VQTKQEFEKRVRSGFGITYSAAWNEALFCVRGFDKPVLLSTDDFFRTVHKPVRDELADEWSAASQA
jgi:hypothetical protein